ncbi:MAG UNVERIFIED_CONTAM: hypothetical protein LVR18_11680 [Planctomycetaceae bacterium]|jgi:hypothetical protein
MGRHLWSILLAGVLIVDVDSVQAQEPRGPGFNELIVVDPGVSDDGKPTVVIQDGKVEVPPSLHVHPNYYSGDREYQAQILQGGPVIIVANHPKSGQKLYIDAILPAAARSWRTPLTRSRMSIRIGGFVSSTVCWTNVGRR